MFTAHIRDDTSRTEQSVREHCEHTAEYAGENGKKLGLENTMYLAGLLHDVGKATEVFHEYIHQEIKKYKKGEINHSSAGAIYLNEKISVSGVIENRAKKLISYAIISHHGLSDSLTLEGEDKYAGRINPEQEIYYTQAIENCSDFIQEEKIKNYFEKSKEEIAEISQKIEQLAANMIHQKNGEVKNFLFGCLQRMMLSVLIDADRRDTINFMNGEEIPVLNQEERTAFFQNFLIKLENHIKKLEQTASLQNKWLTELRHKMSEQCLEASQKHSFGVYKLSIPTGGGKTYASFRYALSLAAKEKKDRIIYTAPYLSILEQNAADLKQVLQNDENILEHHSNILFGEHQDENLKYYELLCDSWDSPVILTTMVRFLDILFGGSSSDIRRMNQLKNSVIIIDEAQSIPVKYINLFNTAVNFLAYICNSVIVMCTATQPIFENTKKPLLYSKNSDIIANMNHQAFKRTEIIGDYAETIFDTESLSEFIFKITKNNCLIILNTKSAVSKLYEAVKDGSEYEVFQLTTNMCPQHRLDLIKEIRQKLKNQEKVICISTQLIEAGVDISFETVVRSLAGLDSIAQAAGRCNRNGENHTYGKAYMIQYEEENLSSLEEIRLARESMKTILKKPHGDWLMPSSISQFYRQYFFDRESDMDGSLSNFMTGLTMYDLMGSNSFGRCRYQKKNNKKYGFPIPQAFKTAASYFSPIEQKHTISIIVYYQNSKELIFHLRNAETLQESKKYLNLLQRYTVNILRNSSIYRKFETMGVFEEQLFDGSVLILSEKYYDQNSGLKPDISDVFMNY